MINLVEVFEPKNTKHIAFEEDEIDFPCYVEWLRSNEITQKYTIVEKKTTLSYFDKR